MILDAVDSKSLRIRRPYSAHSKPIAEGYFTMNGDGNDWVTGGQQYTYDISKGDKFRISVDQNRRGINLWIDGYNGDWFEMDLLAAKDKTLSPGEYLNAHRAPFSGAGPGIDIGGNGRGCNTIVGTFIVIESMFGNNSEVECLDAAFVQHCEGGSSALRGRVRIVNPPQVNSSSLH